MSTIHYKFKSAKGFDKITFDGTGITIYDLKKEIIQQKKLVKSGYMDFDLIISDAQSKEEYSDDSQVVAKNSLVIVRRVPLNAVKKQKIQPVVASKVEQSSLSMQLKNLNSSLIPGLAVNSTENDKIAAMVESSFLQWDKQIEDNSALSMQLNKQRKAKVITKEPPPNYICYRCGQKGHFIHQCPTNSDKSFDLLKVKRTTGIPKSFLKTVDASEIDKANGTVMVTDDGSLVVVQANTSEWEKLNQLKQGSTMSDITSMLSQLAIPAGLTCPLCSSLIRDAVSINCCGTDYCDECIRKSLVEDQNRKFVCPNCLMDATPDQLSPNKALRQSAELFLKEHLNKLK